MGPLAERGEEEEGALPRVRWYIVCTAMEDTAAIYWCDMQGHVAASAGGNVTLLSQEGPERVYVADDRHHNRLDVSERRPGIHQRSTER